MTLPLRLQSKALAQIQQMETGDFELLRYNLRCRYAARLDLAETGALIVDGGSNFGSATNVERTRGQIDHPSGFQPVGTGTNNRVYNYGMNLAGIPVVPTDFTNSYAIFENDGVQQDSNVPRIMELIVDPCIVQMKTDDGGITGDGVGTYRAQVNSPGSNWKGKGLFFRDTFYNGVQGISTTLWLKLSDTPPTVATPTPLRVIPQGLQQHTNQSFEDFIFPLLVRRLNTAGDNRLAYTVGTGTPARPRGTFVDTRVPGTSGQTNQFIHADDYRSSRVPTGAAVTFTTYHLGLV